MEWNNYTWKVPFFRDLIFEKFERRNKLKMGGIQMAIRVYERFSDGNKSNISWNNHVKKLSM